MDTYDTFDDFIEYDADGSSEKENEESPILVPIRQPKTTRDQFNKIASYMNEHAEAFLDKTTHDLLWENLAASLNDIGPPDHTASEWKRIWSVHKHNKKRKRLVESTESDTDVQGDISQLDQQSSTVSVADENVLSKLAEKLDVMIGNQSELHMKIDVIVENQTNMISIQKLIVEELQSSNKFLEEISKKT